jgi:uncharacterized membrane protein (DUF2068 family)
MTVAEPLPPVQNPPHPRDKWSRLIGIGKIVQGVLLFVLAVGALRLIDRAADMEVARGLAHLSIDLDSPWVQRLLDRLGEVDSHQLKTVGAGSFAYSLILLVEGSGLCLRKRWGHYFTVFVTASFLPFELYECFRHFSWPPVAVLLVNVAVLAYLVARLIHERAETS